MRFFHIAREVIQDRRQVHPTPADDLQVREVCLPHLVDGRGLVFELASSLDDDEGRTGDQVVSLEKPLDSDPCHTTSKKPRNLMNGIPI